MWFDFKKELQRKILILYFQNFFRKIVMNLLKIHILLQIKLTFFRP